MSPSDRRPAPLRLALRYAKGTPLAVESLDGLVRLTTRDADGEIEGGVMLAPDEGQRLAQAMLEASFGAGG